MKSLNAKFTVSLLFLIIISFFTNSSICSNGEKWKNDPIIEKDYGDYKHNLNKDGDYCTEEKLYENPRGGLLVSCKTSYQKKSDTRYLGTISVSLTKYINGDFAVQSFAFRHLNERQRRITDDIESQYGSNEIIVARFSRQIVHFWISNDMLIEIGFWNNNKVLEIPEILNDYKQKYPPTDYKQKYPPTHTFTKKDFNLTNLYKKEIELKMQLIELLDDYRDGLVNVDKLKKMQAMSNQCECRRCQTSASLK